MLTHGSLFSGARLLDMGLEQAGFETRWTIEARDGKDITVEDPLQYERVDLLSGGPPCQKGSVLAHYSQPRRTYQTLWGEMLRFAKALRPSWVLVENVPGFQRQMVDWTADLHELGYGCAGQLIDSRHWVPQQRTRCFVIARLGVEGMALWHHLYAPSERSGPRAPEGHQAANHAERGRRGAEEMHIFTGSCPDCLRDGVFARHKARTIACVGAGNGVTVELAQFLGERIQEAEKSFVLRRHDSMPENPSGRFNG